MQRILLLQHFLEILAMQRGVLQNRRSKIATMGRKTETKNTNYMCEIVKGDLVLKEHEAARWLNKKSIDDVEWLPADITLIEKVRERL